MWCFIYKTETTIYEAEKKCSVRKNNAQLDSKPKKILRAYLSLFIDNLIIKTHIFLIGHFQFFFLRLP